MTFENPVGRLTLVWNTLHQAHIKGDAVPLDDGALNAAEREADRLPTTNPSSVERKSKQTISVVQTAHRVPRLRRLLDEVVDGVAEVSRLAEVGIYTQDTKNGYQQQQ